MKPLPKNRLFVWLNSKIMFLANLLQKIPAKTTPPAFRLMQIGSLFWQSRAPENSSYDLSTFRGS